MIRECPKCKWVYPNSYQFAKCRYCSTLLSHNWCNSCQQMLPTTEFYLTRKGAKHRHCRKCTIKEDTAYQSLHLDKHRERNNAWYARKLAAFSDEYTKWEENTSVDFKMLSEKEWLKTCMHFDGCALCGDHHIESREFFVPFQEGGKYTPWNVFPMCGNCKVKVNANPFKWLKNIPEERSKKLLDYFTVQVERSKNATDI